MEIWTRCGAWWGRYRCFWAYPGGRVQRPGHVSGMPYRIESEGHKHQSRPLSTAYPQSSVHLSPQLPQKPSSFPSCSFVSLYPPKRPHWLDSSSRTASQQNHSKQVSCVPVEAGAVPSISQNRSSIRAYQCQSIFETSSRTAQVVVVRSQRSVNTFELVASKDRRKCGATRGPTGPSTD